MSRQQAGPHDEPSAGRFTAEAMFQALHEVAAQIGVTVTDARLLRLANSAVFALPGAGLVVRITRSYQLRDRVAKVARLATWFAEIEAPTVRPSTQVTQPVAAYGLLATIWQYLPPTQPPPSVEDLGQVLRKFHALGQPPFPLPAWDPVADARRRLDDAEGLRDTDRDFLLDWCDRLQPRLAELSQRTGAGLVHGDAHVGNLLRDRCGRVVLCDFDATCTGPWQVDLATVPVSEARFGRAGTHHRLVTAYGYDVTRDPDWPVFRQARELKMVVAAVPLLASAPGVADEFATRLRSVVLDETDSRWTPFADLRRERRP